MEFELDLSILLVSTKLASMLTKRYYALSVNYL